MELNETSLFPTDFLKAVNILKERYLSVCMWRAYAELLELCVVHKAHSPYTEKHRDCLFVFRTLNMGLSYQWIITVKKKINKTVFDMNTNKNK